MNMSSSAAASGCDGGQDQNMLSSAMIGKAHVKQANTHSCCTRAGSLLNQRLGKTTTVCFPTLLSDLSSNPAE